MKNNNPICTSNIIIIKMSLKQFFVLFSSKVNVVPTIYKTKATINKHITKNPDLEFKTFNSEI